MGRSRTFDIDAAVDAAAQQFLTTGYEATSIDMLVAATGVHRGSLYKAFGSKRGLFVAVLEQATTRLTATDRLDLLLITLLELAPSDPAVRQVAERLLAEMADGDRPTILGRRLVERAGLADLPTETDTLTDTAIPTDTAAAGGDPAMNYAEENHP